MNITAILMRRSLGRSVFPAFTALILLNTLLRSMSWRHEWMWAVYQYNFTVILLGPLLAGVAGWEGYRLARASDFLSGHHRPVALLTAVWAALFAWCAVAFAAGLAIVLAVVAISGAPLHLGLAEIVTPVPAFALLAAESAAGLVAGWLAHSKLAAPMAAISVFLGSLLLYAGNFSEFITVGGATSSLVGLQPKLSIQASQTTFYCLAVVLAITVGSWLSSWYRAPRWPAVMMVSVLTATSAVVLSMSSPLYLEKREGDVACSGAHPEICLGYSYANLEPEVRDSLTPYVKAVEEIGIKPPASFRQDASSSRNVGQLSLDTITGSKDVIPDMFLGTYYGSQCEIVPGGDIEKSYSNARYWLTSTVGTGEQYDPVVDRVFVKGTPEERASAARAAFATLMACHG